MKIDHRVLFCTSYDYAMPSVHFSLLNSIVNERGSRTVGTSEEVSTVGIELRRHHQRNGRTVEFYDCAGQVDYYGMHQTFLTRRALYLLVWDVSRCHGKESNDLDKVSVTLSRRCTGYYIWVLLYR